MHRPPNSDLRSPISDVPNHRDTENAEAYDYEQGLAAFVFAVIPTHRRTDALATDAPATDVPATDAPTYRPPNSDLQTPISDVPNHRDTENTELSMAGWRFSRRPEWNVKGGVAVCEVWRWGIEW